jgi:GDP-4-dehydro-6-deoxy-D-mannose reductase
MSVKDEKKEGKRILITGLNGFVGKHLGLYLTGKGHSVTGIPRHIMMKSSFLKKFAESIPFDVMIHLAAQSSPYISWQDPYSTIMDNTVSTMNVLSVSEKTGCKLIVAGTAEVYDMVEMPLIEKSPLNPRNPYGVSKYISDIVIRMISSEKRINVTLLRLFNNAGPGQTESFVVSSFAKQFAEMKLGRISCILKVGNINVIRDFVDVRDVVKAYEVFLDREEYGDFYNVCSGIGRSLSWIIGKFVEISGIDVTVETDSEKFRPNDIPVFEGRYDKLEKLGWKPEYSMERTLRDTYEWWMDRLG